MWDFLTLRLLVTPYLIIFVYWAVALLLPLFALLVTIVLTRWLIPRLRALLEPWVRETGVLEIEEVQHLSQSLQQQLQHYRWAKWLFWTAFVLFVLIFELIWRLFCEFLIVYYNMHDALIEMARAAG